MNESQFGGVAVDEAPSEFGGTPVALAEPSEFGGVPVTVAEPSEFGGLPVEQGKAIHPEKANVLLPRTGPQSTIWGGPPKRVDFDYPALMESIQSDADTALERFAAPRANPSEPRLPIPSIPIGKDMAWPVAAGAEAVNVAKGIPEFFTSDLGIASALTGTLAPRLLALGFSADLTMGAYQQAKQTIADWNQLTPAEKAKGAVDVLGGMLMAILTGSHAAGKPVRTIPRIVAPVQTGPAAPPPGTELQDLRPTPNLTGPVAGAATEPSEFGGAAELTPAREISEPALPPPSGQGQGEKASPAPTGAQVLPVPEALTPVSPASGPATAPTEAGTGIAEELNVLRAKAAERTLSPEDQGRLDELNALDRAANSKAAFEARQQEADQKQARYSVILADTLSTAIRRRDPIPASVLDSYNQTVDVPSALPEGYARAGDQWIYTEPAAELTPAQRMVRENQAAMRALSEAKAGAGAETSNLALNRQ